MKATDVIRQDHRAIEDLFTEFKEASPERREEMEDIIFDALDTHEKMEDEYFYPAIRDEVEDADMVMELENQQMKLKVEVLAARALPGDRDKRIEEMMDTILAHAEKEEREILPEAERVLGSEKLEALGEEMEPESAVANAEL